MSIQLSVDLFAAPHDHQVTAKLSTKKVDFDVIRPMGKTLYSWDAYWKYCFTDVFPQSSHQCHPQITQKQLGNSSIVTRKPNLTDMQDVFDV
jgi:hypothetical protein